MKQSNIRHIEFIFFAAMTLSTFSVQAQQAGDMVEVTWAGANTKGKIDTCRDAGCYLYLFDATSGKWSEGTAFFQKDQIRGMKIVAPPVTPPTVRQDDVDKSKPKVVPIVTPVHPAVPVGTTAGCSFDPPGTNVSRSSAASEQLFKRVIYDWFNLDAKQGGTTNPLKVGVTFLEFQSAKSFVNRIIVDPGRGARRMHDGAPTDAIIYPVKTKFVHCRAYRDSIQRQVVQEDFACFKDKFGDWTCPGDSVLKILETTSLPAQK